MQGPTDERTARPKVPSSCREYLQAMGPGLVVSLMWLGAGDLIDSSVAGATYGYALMWSLAVALISRYFFVSALAKYQLRNSEGDEKILQGYARLWRGVLTPILSRKVPLLHLLGGYASDSLDF